MGVIRQFSCPSCRRAWRLRLGCGLMHGSLRNVLRELPGGLQGSVPADADPGRPEAFDFQYRAAACGGCGALVAVPVLELPGTGRRYEGGCPLCGGGALAFADAAPLQCPACGEPGLTGRNVGYWD